MDGLMSSVANVSMMGGMDPELLRQMQEEGLISEEDLAMSDAEITESVITPLPEEIQITDEDAAEAESHLQKQEARQGIYEEQESTADLVEPENKPQEAPAAIVKKAAKAAKAAKSGGSTADGSLGVREARVAKAGSTGAYVASITGPEIELVTGVPVDIQTVVDGVNAVKVREKVANWFDHFHKGHALSVFTQIALNTLQKEGQITAKRLVEVYQNTPQRNVAKGNYDEGTARSQAQQEITLLRALHVITSDGQANANSVYWQRITAGA